MESRVYILGIMLTGWFCLEKICYYTSSCISVTIKRCKFGLSEDVKAPVFQPRAFLEQGELLAHVEV
jgi:hypothetical protein